MTDPVPPPRRNVVPGAYRGVAVTEVDVPLEDGALAAWFTGREAYRRTRFVVVRNGGATAVLAVQKASDEPLFSTITGVRTLVGPADCAYLRCPEVDTAVPSALAASSSTSSMSWSASPTPAGCSTTARRSPRARPTWCGATMR